MDRSPSLDRRATAALVGLVSSATVCTEILLTRLLCIAAWYSLVFVILSLAMVGLAAGSLIALEARQSSESLAEWTSRWLLRFAGGIFAALVAVTVIPLSIGTLAPNLSDLMGFVMVAVAIALPLRASGALLARLLSEESFSLPLLYGVDLGCAALGALAPLVLLGPLNAPQAMLLLCVGTSLAAVLVAPERASWRLKLLPVAFLAMLIAATVPRFGFQIGVAKGKIRDPSPLFSTWNPLAFVSAPRFWVDTPKMWGPSPRMPPSQIVESVAAVDGDAGTALYKFKSLADLDFLRWDSTTFAHQLRPTGTACVIGLGGGRDVLAARLFGHERVVAMEINPGMVQMLRQLHADSPVLDDPAVEVRVGDGRSLLVAAHQKCRVLQASLVDTWAATVAGAFAHAEATLYTLEAWSAFLESVEPDGILTFSRHYAPTRITETVRLLSLATGALLQRGVADPSRHILLIAGARVATILVSPAPFSAEDMAKYDAVMEQMQFVAIAAPGRPPKDPLLAAILRARTVEELAEVGKPEGVDTSAPTDDRPFFFQLATFSLMLRDFRWTSQEGVMTGNVRAMAELILAFFCTLAVGLALLGPTLWRALRAREAALPGAQSVVYFGALGMGYMLVEMALVQRLHMVLGHPARALVIVLAGLLVATGLGSVLSERLIRTRRGVRIAAAAAGLLVALLPWLVIGPLARRTLDSPLWIRALWCGACAGLAGLLLGTLFPSGLRFLSRERGVPLALAVNGLTSVIGSVGAVIVSIFFGIPMTFAVAGAVYGIAALVAPPSWRVAPAGG